MDTSILTTEVRSTPVKYRDIIKVIEQDGWHLLRQVGSHRHNVHPTKPGVVTIAHHGLGSDIPRGTLKSILRQAGLK
jgi:predicted RNA binding protein YcfA (HicA-like mRNA interferase family)